MAIQGPLHPTFPRINGSRRRSFPKATAGRRVLHHQRRDPALATLALSEDRDQHVGAGHVFVPGRLHVDDGALNDALEAGSRFGILGSIGDQIVQLGSEVGESTLRRSFCKSTLYRPHYCRGILISISASSRCSSVAYS